MFEERMSEGNRWHSLDANSIELAGFVLSSQTLMSPLGLIRNVWTTVVVEKKDLTLSST